MLPKSGVVLTQFDTNIWKGPLCHLACSGAFFMVSFAGEHGRSDLAEYLDEGGIRRVRGDAKSRCIAWLDTRVLETRAALTPPGHVVVGPDARERVARACQASVEPEPIPAERTLDVGWYVVADAVLAAIGVRG